MIFWDRFWSSYCTLRQIALESPWCYTWSHQQKQTTPHQRNQNQSNSNNNSPSPSAKWSLHLNLKDLHLFMCALCATAHVKVRDNLWESGSAVIRLGGKMLADKQMTPSPQWGAPVLPEPSTGPTVCIEMSGERNALMMQLRKKNSRPRTWLLGSKSCTAAPATHTT